MRRLLLMLLGVSLSIGALLTGCTGENRKHADTADASPTPPQAHILSDDRDAHAVADGEAATPDFASSLAKARALIAMEKSTRASLPHDDGRMEQAIWSNPMEMDGIADAADAFDDPFDVFAMKGPGSTKAADGRQEALDSLPMMDIPNPAELDAQIESLLSMGADKAPSIHFEEGELTREERDFLTEVMGVQATGAPEADKGVVDVVVPSESPTKSDDALAYADLTKEMDLDAFFQTTPTEPEALAHAMEAMEVKAPLPQVDLPELPQWSGDGLEATAGEGIAKSADEKLDDDILSLLAALDLVDDLDMTPAPKQDLLDDMGEGTPLAAADPLEGGVVAQWLTRDTYYIDQDGEKTPVDVERTPHPVIPGETEETLKLDGETYVVKMDDGAGNVPEGAMGRYVVVGGRKLYLAGEKREEARKFYIDADGEKVYLPSPKKPEAADTDEVVAERDPEAKPDAEVAEAAPEVKEEPLTEREIKVQRLIDMTTVEGQAQALEARNKFYAGVNFFENHLYNEALRAFEDALMLDPDQEDATAYLRRTRHVLNRPASGDDAAMLETIIESQHHALQYQEVTMQQELSRATNHYLSAIQPDVDRILLDRVSQIVRGLEDLKTAQESVENVRIQLRTALLPADVERNYRLQAEGLEAQIVALRHRLVNEQGTIERETARQELEETRQTTAERQQRTLEELFAAVHDQFEREEFDKALELLDQIRRMSPGHPGFIPLRDGIRRAKHMKNNRQLDQDTEDATQMWALDIRQAYILPKDILIYPDNWEEIRARARVSRTADMDTEMETQITAQLERVRIPLIEFPEQPLSLVMDEIRNRTGVNIVMSPEVDGNAMIDQVFPNMNMFQILEWICEIQDLGYSIQDEAIYITPSGAGPQQFVLELYPVADLTRPMRDYYTPAMLGEIPYDEHDLMEDPMELTELIRSIIPGWDDPRASLEIWEDNLLVMQTQQVHQQITHYLRLLRDASKQQVLVEGRFLDVRDDFYEHIGFEWLGNFWESVHTGRQLFAGLGVRPQIGMPDQLQFIPPPPDAVPVRTYNYGLGMEGVVGGVMKHTNQTSPPGAYQWASVFQALQLNYVMDAVRRTMQGSILHNPKLLVPNGKNAYVVVRTVTNYTPEYRIQGAFVEPIVEQYQQGVVWSVRPVISFDRKYITVRARPRVEQLVDSEDIAFFMFATDGDTVIEWEGGGFGGPGTARIQIRTTEVIDFESNVTVPDGGTVLIGGEIRDERNESIRGVPVLSSIPALGRLFRTEQTTKVGRNRVIMLSARIIEMED